MKTIIKRPLSIEIAGDILRLALDVLKQEIQLSKTDQLKKIRKVLHSCVILRWFISFLELEAAFCMQGKYTVNERVSD